MGETLAKRYNTMENKSYIKNTECAKGEEL